MVTTEDLSKQFGPNNLTVAELEAFLDSLRALADIVVQTFKREQADRSRALSFLSDEAQDNFEERAAIIEFEGGFARVTAERVALRTVEGAVDAITKKH